MGMTALKYHIGVASQGVAQPMFVHIRIAKPNQHKRDPPALPFYQSIGRQGGRQGRQCNLAWLHARLFQNRSHSAANAFGQIMACRQRLGRGNHPLFVPDQNRICICPTGINTQRQTHADLLL